MSQTSSMAQLLASQMLDKQALSVGRLTDIGQHHQKSKGRHVPITFKIPDSYSRSDIEQFEKSLKRKLPESPNSGGFINVTTEDMKRFERQHHLIRIDVLFKVPDLSSKFFSGREKGKFLDRQGRHIVAQALAGLIAYKPNDKASKELRSELSNTFPDSRRWFDQATRRIVKAISNWLCDVVEEMKSWKRDKYDDYR